jgi:hypothetical protein
MRRDPHGPAGQSIEVRIEVTTQPSPGQKMAYARLWHRLLGPDPEHTDTPEASTPEASMNRAAGEAASKRRKKHYDTTP